MKPIKNTQKYAYTKKKHFLFILAETNIDPPKSYY